MLNRKKFLAMAVAVLSMGVSPIYAAPDEQSTHKQGDKKCDKDLTPEQHKEKMMEKLKEQGLSEDEITKKMAEHEAKVEEILAKNGLTSKDMESLRAIHKESEEKFEKALEEKGIDKQKFKAMAKELKSLHKENK
ncbi:MAG: hypothetical protein ATN36_07920 [Epulopiscium sp. Nele67-Bin005]|nr:MAG: hypothetical protein ATN36_07920 [Epulopiscium sp. Nele67-Bin005]